MAAGRSAGGAPVAKQSPRLSAFSSRALSLGRLFLSFDLTDAFQGRHHSFVFFACFDQGFDEPLSSLSRCRGL